MRIMTNLKLHKINESLEKAKKEENIILEELKAAEIDLNINLSQRENFISEIKKLEIEKKKIFNI